MQHLGSDRPCLIESDGLGGEAARNNVTAGVTQIHPRRHASHRAGSAITVIGSP